MSAQLEKILSFIKNNKITVVLLSIGLVILVFGLLSDIKSKNTSLKEGKDVITFSSKSTAPEMISETKSQTVFVDVSGAVRVPGVWEMSYGSRVGEAIIKAGGFSEDANTAWIDKNLNQALPVKDGMKIYIPRTGETSTPVLGSVSISSGTSLGQSPTCGEGLIDINNASSSSLDTLPQIAEVRVAAIISGRPYSSINDLLTKKILTSGVFEAIKDKICL